MKIKSALFLILLLGTVWLFRRHSPLHVPARIKSRVAKVENTPAKSESPHRAPADKPAPPVVSASLAQKLDQIDSATVRADAVGQAAAAASVMNMLKSGTVAEVLAVLPRAANFPENMMSELADIQVSLCRFQNSAADEFGFEIIKHKFNTIFGREAGVKPWPLVCRAG